MFISARILVSATNSWVWIIYCTKVAKIKIILIKLDTNKKTKQKQLSKMLIYWCVLDRLVTPGTESLTWHIDLLDAVTHRHLQLVNLAEDKLVSTFSSSHLQNFHFEGSWPEWCISAKYIMLEIHHSGREPSIYILRMRQLPTQVLSRHLQVQYESKRLTNRLWCSLSGQVFQSGCHQFSSSRNILDITTKWPPIHLESLNGWLVVSVNHSNTTCTDWWWPKQNRFTLFENELCKNEIVAWGKLAKSESENFSNVKYTLQFSQQI